MGPPIATRCFALRRLLLEDGGWAVAHFSTHDEPHGGAAAGESSSHNIRAHHTLYAQRRARSITLILASISPPLTRPRRSSGVLPGPRNAPALPRRPLLRPAAGAPRLQGGPVLQPHNAEKQSVQARCAGSVPRSERAHSEVFGLQSQRLQHVTASPAVWARLGRRRGAYGHFAVRLRPPPGTLRLPRLASPRLAVSLRHSASPRLASRDLPPLPTSSSRYRRSSVLSAPSVRSSRRLTALSCPTT